jgi:hypothetical protein
MKTELLFIIFFALLLARCEKDKPHGPYDPSTHSQQLSAKINGVDFTPDKLTVASPISENGEIGIIGNDLTTYIINIEFPINCGERTFNLPTEQSAILMINNINCEYGILRISKYDSNLVEGTFEFDVEINNSILQITDGSFSIVYRLN